MNFSNPYLFLFLAIIFGTASNSFAKSAEGFSQWMPSIASSVTIILCMYTLSNVMKSIPMGITYASFAGLCIIATAIVGIIKYNQLPNIFTIIGLLLIIVGVVMVNLLGKTGS
jgi:small multidrug resistance pump